MSTPRGYTTFPSSADLFYYCTTTSTSNSLEDLNLRYSPPSKSSLKIGVVVVGTDQVQLLDLAVVDLLAKISRIQIDLFHAPESTQDQAVDELDIRYVNESGEGSFGVTSGARMPVTNSFENAPQFDILIIPGSFTSADLTPSSSSFFSTQVSNSQMLAVMSIASGILHLAQTGLLHQKRATGPECLLPSLRERLPGTTWEDMPWTRHERFWSSGSAISALDMVAAWMREYFWDRGEAVERALGVAGVKGLGEYEE